MTALTAEEADVVKRPPAPWPQEDGKTRPLLAKHEDIRINKMARAVRNDPSGSLTYPPTESPLSPVDSSHSFGQLQMMPKIVRIVNKSKGASEFATAELVEEPRSPKAQ